MTNNDRLTPKGAAEYLSERTGHQFTEYLLEKYRNRHKGPVFFKPAGTHKITYKVSDLDAFLDSGRTDPSQRPERKEKRRGSTNRPARSRAAA
jgi:hypothetical protein